MNDIDYLFLRVDFTTILYVIMSKPLCNAQEIKRITKIPTTVLYRHLDKLIEKNLVKQLKSKNTVGRKVYVYESKIDKLEILMAKNYFNLNMIKK